MISFQALQILIFLIPGFISSSILNSLIVRRDERREFPAVIEALIFSMLVYTAYAVIRGTSPIALDQQGQAPTLSYEAMGFLWLLLISVVLPMSMSFLVTTDLHMKIARGLRITRRTSRSSTWFDVFYDIKTYVIIDFDNGRRVYGWPMYYSDNPEDQYVFLHDPYWIEGEEFIETGLKGLLITPAQRIEFIEFLEGPAESKGDQSHEGREAAGGQDPSATAQEGASQGI